MAHRQRGAMLKVLKLDKQLLAIWPAASPEQNSASWLDQPSPARFRRAL
jgi:hypothetical protein